MTRRHVAVFFSILALLTVSCKQKEAEEIGERLSVKLDPSLSEKEKQLLRADVEDMYHRDLQIPETSWYVKAFGGDSSLDALRYMDERINYVLPEKVKVTSRLFPLTRPPEPLAASASSTVTMARNVGTELWWTQVALGQDVLFQIGTAMIPIDSTRVGIIQLGKGYTLSKTTKGMSIGSIVRGEILMHEARHSDCTGGLTEEGVMRLRAAEDVTGMLCGHSHVPCPEGHDLAGLSACDGHAWGAYAMGGLYANAVALYCENCSESEKQVAAMMGIDSYDRILVLDDMLSARFGNPDMSSSDALPMDEIRKRLMRFRTERLRDPARINTGLLHGQ